MEAHNEANEIVEEMYANPDVSVRRIAVSRENNALIDELRSACDYVTWLKYHVVGVAGTRRKWFVLRSLDTRNVGPGIVIKVDFRARKVLGRVA